MANGKYVTKHVVPECVEVLELVLSGNTKYSIRSKDIAESWYLSMHPDYRNTPVVKEELKYISQYIGRRMFSKLEQRGIMSKASKKSYDVDFEACEVLYKKLLASKQSEPTAAS